MIYEVRILNPKGKIKKRISTLELRQLHWKGFTDPILFAIKKDSIKITRNLNKQNSAKLKKS